MSVRPARFSTTAVILAGGLGTRMRANDDDARSPALTPAQRAAADAGAKGLVPVGGRPLLDHVLDALRAGGVRDVVFVVAPGESALHARYLHGSLPGLAIRFAEQREPRGTAHALLAAREQVMRGPPGDPRRTGDAGVPDFLMLNADNLYPVESIAALVNLGTPGLVAYEADSLVALGNIDRERVRRFALLDLDGDDTLVDIVEKPGPDHPLAMSEERERWVSMNLWRFGPAIFDDCAQVQPSIRGELELADAVRHAIQTRGERFHAVRQRLGVLDLSRRADIATVDARLSRLRTGDARSSSAGPERT